MLSAVLDTLILSLIIMAKVAYVTCEVNDRADLLSVSLTTLAGLMMLFSWLVFARRRTRISVMLFFDFLVTVLLMADVLFNRYSHGIITLPMLNQAGQVGMVSSSVFELFKKGDILTVADLILLVPIHIIWHETKKKAVKSRGRIAYVGVCAVVCCAIIGSMFWGVSRTYGKDNVLDIYSNSLVLRTFGVLNYHVADLILEDQVLPVSVEEVRHWDALHKHTESCNLSGIGKGKNLIIIEMEALQQFVIGSKVDGQDVTPNLNALIQESIYFDNYFSQIAEGNTSDAEFISLTSMYPLQAGSAFVLRGNNTYRALPSALKDLEYRSYAFHAFNPDYYNRDKVFVSLGFDKFICNKDYHIPFEDVVGLGLSDVHMFDQTFEKISRLPRPSLFFIVSLTAHHPYDLPNDLKELRIKKDEVSPLFAEYLQVEHYADRALGRFIDKLRQSGILDNSVFVVYGDHFAPELNPEEIYKIEGRSGKPDVYQNAELCRVPLMIRLPDGHHKEVCHRTGGQIDLYPTLANIMGLDNDEMLVFGNDLLNSRKGFAAFRRYIPSGSFVNDDYFYISCDDGMFYSGTCYSRADGKAVNVGYCFADYKRMKHEIDMSDFILQNNNIKRILSH